MEYLSVNSVFPWQKSIIMCQMVTSDTTYFTGIGNLTNESMTNESMTNDQ